MEGCMIPIEKYQQALKRLEQSEAKRAKLVDALDTLKQRTVSLLCVSDRDKQQVASLEQQLASAMAERARLQQELAQAEARRTAADRQAAEAQRKAAGRSASPAPLQQQQARKPPTASSARPSGSSGAGGGMAELRLEVEHLRGQVRLLQEALKQAEGRAAQHASRLTTHGAQLQHLQRLVGPAACRGSMREAAPAASEAMPPTPSALSAGGPQLQLEQVVAAVLAQVMPAISHKLGGAAAHPSAHKQADPTQPGSTGGRQQRVAGGQGAGPADSAQQQHHHHHHAPACPWGAVGNGSSRAASLEPEWSGAATAHHPPGAPGQRHAAAGWTAAGSQGRVSSLAATTHALPVATPTPRGLGLAPGCSSGSLSSVMHSGATLQGPPSPADGWGGGSAYLGSAPAPTVTASDPLGGSRLTGGSTDSSGDVDGGCDGEICSPAAAAEAARGGSKRRAPPGAAAAEGVGSAGKRQRLQQDLLLRLGQKLSQLRRPQQASSTPTTVDQPEAAVADALAAEVAPAGGDGCGPTGTAGALAQAFRAAALSGAAGAWDAAQFEDGEYDAEEVALLAWTADPAGEAKALPRLARCARLLAARLPADGGGGAFLASLVDHLRGALAVEGLCGGDRAAAAAAGARRTPVGEALPLACAAAAALACLFRELGRAEDARGLVLDLLAARRQRPPPAPAGMPVLPLALAAAAMWPRALAPGRSSRRGQQPEEGCVWRALAARAPRLAVLHAALLDACASTDLGSGGGSDGAPDEGPQPPGREDCAAAAVVRAVGSVWWGPCWDEGGAAEAGPALPRVAGALRALQGSSAAGGGDSAVSKEVGQALDLAVQLPGASGSA